MQIGVRLTKKVTFVVDDEHATLLSLANNASQYVRDAIDLHDYLLKSDPSRAPLQLAHELFNFYNATRTNGPVKELFDRAGAMHPWMDVRGLLYWIAADWMHMREEDSRRSSRKRQEETLAAILKIAQEIKEKLDNAKPSNND